MVCYTDAKCYQLSDNQRKGHLAWGGGDREPLTSKHLNFINGIQRRYVSSRDGPFLEENLRNEDIKGIL